MLPLVVAFSVPATPLEGESGAGDHFDDVSATFRTLLCGGVGELLAQFESVAAGVALVFVDRHLLNNLLN